MRILSLNTSEIRESSDLNRSFTASPQFCISAVIAQMGEWAAVWDHRDLDEKETLPQQYSRVPNKHVGFNPARRSFCLGSSWQILPFLLWSAFHLCHQCWLPLDTCGLTDGWSIIHARQRNNLANLWWLSLSGVCFRHLIQFLSRFLKPCKLLSL